MSLFDKIKDKVRKEYASYNLNRQHENAIREKADQQAKKLYWKEKEKVLTNIAKQKAREKARSIIKPKQTNSSFGGFDQKPYDWGLGMNTKKTKPYNWGLR